MLNDPQFVEASRMLAQRMMKEEEETENQLVKVFRVATGRFPDDTELSLLSELYEAESEKFNKNPKDALAYLSVGEIAWDRSLDPSKLAALSVVANATINTGEGYTKN